MSTYTASRHYEVYLQQIADKFYLGRIVTFAYIPEALANYNWKITTEKNVVFIIKIFDELNQHRFENYLYVSKQLKSIGIDSVTFLRLPSGGYIYHTDHFMAIVSPQISGLNPTENGDDISESIGVLLALFHLSITQLPFENEGWLHIRALPEKTSNESSLLQKARATIEYTKNIFQKRLPTGIIHGDIIRTNIFVADNDVHNIVALYDFETAERNFYIFDIARSALEFCQNDTRTMLEQVKIDKMIGGYEKRRKLSDEEKQVLPQAMLYVAAITAFWFVRMGYPEIAENYIDIALLFYRSNQL